MPRIRQVPFSATVLLILGSVGCVSFSARPLAPDWTASTQIERREVSGLSLAARTLDGLREEEALVGRPAREHGFHAVVLLFENHGDTVFHLRRSNIALETHDGLRFPAAALEDIYSGLRYSKGTALWGLPLGIFPAFVIGNRISEQNGRLLEDLRDKTFHDRRFHQDPAVYNALVFFDMRTGGIEKLDPAQYWICIDVETESTPDKPAEKISFRLAPGSH